VGGGVVGGGGFAGVGVDDQGGDEGEIGVAAGLDEFGGCVVDAWVAGVEVLGCVGVSVEFGDEFGVVDERFAGDGLGEAHA